MPFVCFSNAPRSSPGFTVVVAFFCAFCFAFCSFLLLSASCFTLHRQQCPPVNSQHYICRVLHRAVNGFSSGADLPEEFLYLLFSSKQWGREHLRAPIGDQASPLAKRCGHDHIIVPILIQSHGIGVKGSLEAQTSSCSSTSAQAQTSAVL